ncbi:hypothetical protein ACFQ1E_17490 [Sphingomonas canadensis]|uniref:Uncharacterized protein n=1 Tax=Sphingomonas canadensis TaxID=1219257 RepID=A0ABW3H9I1_9SPHN|nr:hypothetical protein [Sphingomonas canadensis]MCW3837841.1 hypothetical protein [Sphingomonas canadensis]
MELLTHPNATRCGGPPADWDEERDGPCGTLAIADVLTADRRPAMESLWRPDRTDIERLIAGGAIALGVVGTMHPVVYLAVTEPGVI